MSTTIDIIHNSNRKITSPSHTNEKKPFCPINEKCDQSVKNIIHSLKVGFALVLVSLIYILDPLFEQVGENAMWAIMTVEVIFEFFAGLSLSSYSVNLTNSKAKVGSEKGRRRQPYLYPVGIEGLLPVRPL
ncbi:putative aluminum-activated malate transporter [Helianthus anomalus]